MKCYRESLRTQSLLLLSLLLAFIFSGCSTTSKTPGSRIIEGPKIKNSDSFVLESKQIRATPLGVKMRFEVIPRVIRHYYKVEQWRESWEMVKRRRYLSVAGMHRKYNLGQDVVGDPALAALSLLVSPFLLFTDERIYILAGPVSILPFMTLNNNPVTETVRKSEKRTRINPKQKVFEVRSTALNEKRINWKLLYPDGEVRDKGRVEWPNPIWLDWCDLIIDDPEVTEWRLRLSSEDILLRGGTAGLFPADLRDAVLRKWPDVSKRPKPRLRVKEAELTDKAGEPLSILYSGIKGLLKLDVKNRWFFSSTAYYLQPFVEQNSGPQLTIDIPPARPRLESGDKETFDISVMLPLEAAGGHVDLQVGLKDAFGVVVHSQELAFKTVTSKLPELELFEASIRPSSKRGEKRYELILVLRNRGSGSAKRVRIEVVEPVEQSLLEKKTLMVPEIESLSRHTVTIGLRGEPAKELGIIRLKFRISEELGVSGIHEERDVGIYR